MKQLSTWLTSPVGQDSYGTSGLTGLQLIIACILVFGAFIYLAMKDKADRKLEHNEPWNQ